MPRDGAAAALRGYRLQTLYILSRLLDVEHQELWYLPEGKEDLDIHSPDGELLETVQVKAYSDNLSLSNFASQLHDSFFDRSLRNRRSFPDSTIRIVSFGRIGPEIEAAWSQEGPERQRVREKLREYGYSSGEISEIFDIKFSMADESELEAKVADFLQASPAGGDPLNAFELLMYWVFRASEQSERIEYSSVIEKLSSVGRYLQQRSAYHDEWFNSIHPLIDTQHPDEVDTDHLADEYYRGVDARYDHILADLDVIRSEKLTEIQRKFESRDVVIVHGASGQGKSTLAFRYIHDYTPNVWRFFVDSRRIENTRQLQNVANALSGHAKAIDLPCIVYVDISPSDQDWPTLVRTLSVLPKLQVLVTIREEDWRRATGYGAHFLFEEMELDFDRAEAENLSTQLLEQNPNFLTFEEAWAGFGEQGPLLEFVYFLTQRETLKARIKSQIRNLQERLNRGDLQANELHMLRLVATASAYEAKLDLSSVDRHLNLNALPLTIEMFAKEYLVRVDAEYSTVSGLHSVRSSIMLESLLDSTLYSWESIAKECLQLVVESDLEIFLLHAFSRRREEASSVIEQLNEFQPNSWVGMAGVLRALLWLGVRDYTEANRELIDQVYLERGPAWYLLLDSDLTGIAKGAITDIWDNLWDFDGKDRHLEYVASVREKQTPKEEAFVPARTWLRHIDPTDILPSNLHDFAGLAQVLFWSSHLQIQQLTPLLCKHIEIGEVVEKTPLDTLANLIYVLHIADEKRLETILSEYQHQIELRFKLETNSFSLEDDGETIRAHFIPDFVYLIDPEVQDDANSISRSLHEETMYRVDLLRKLLPTHQKYGSHGYGHRMGILAPEYDDSEKTIDSSNFFPPWAQRINAHFLSLGDYPYRPNNWESHAQEILELRQELHTWLGQLQRALDAYFRKRQATKRVGLQFDNATLGKFKRLADSRPPLPQSAVDEWGFVSEGLVQDSNNDPNNLSVEGLYLQFPAITKNKSYIDLLHRFLRHLSNFMTQGLHVAVLNSSLGRADANMHDTLIQIAQEQGIETDREDLTTFNLLVALDALAHLQVEFRNRFDRILSGYDLGRLEGREQKLIRELWPMWHQFAFHPKRVRKGAVKAFVKKRHNALEEIKKNIREKVKAVKKEHYSADIAKNDLKLEGENITTILVNADHPMSYWKAVEATLEALKEALHTESTTSLRYYATLFSLERFAVIPLFRGKALSPFIFVVPSSELSSGNARRHLHQFNREILYEDWTNLNVAIWDREQFEPAIRFTENFEQLSLLSLSAGDLSRFPDKSACDSTVIDGFVRVQSENLSKSLQRVCDEFTELTKYHEDLEHYSDRPFLGEAMKLLVEIGKQIRPTEDFNGTSRLTVVELGAWSRRLEELRIKAEAFKLLWITDVLDQQITGE